MPGATATLARAPCLADALDAVPYVPLGRPLRTPSWNRSPESRSDAPASSTKTKRVFIALVKVGSLEWPELDEWRSLCADARRAIGYSDESPLPR